MAEAMISSVVSVSVARADPSASSGMSPRVSSDCRAGPSPLHVHVNMSVLSSGTATVSTGIGGRYFATRRAVDPPRVSTTMSDARILCAMRTAEEASDSSGDIGSAVCCMIDLNLR